MFNIMSHWGNANQSHSEIPLHPIIMATFKMMNNQKDGKAMEKLENSYTAGG